MTKVLLALNKQDIIVKEFYDEDGVIFKGRYAKIPFYAEADAQKMVEALIKETKQRVLEEVDSLPKYFMTHNEEWIKIEDVNKLREKYKGVE
jgi:hypothetical protein